MRQFPRRNYVDLFDNILLQTRKTVSNLTFFQPPLLPWSRRLRTCKCHRYWTSLEFPEWSARRLSQGKQPKLTSRWQSAEIFHLVARVEWESKPTNGVLEELSFPNQHSNDHSDLQKLETSLAEIWKVKFHYKTNEYLYFFVSLSFHFWVPKDKRESTFCSFLIQSSRNRLSLFCRYFRNQAQVKNVLKLVSCEVLSNE